MTLQRIAPLSLLLLSLAMPLSLFAASSKKAPTFGPKDKLLTGTYTATLTTSKGTIVLELNANAAPKTVTNFVMLAKSGYYNGLTFHRVIDGFMIQGGDPNGNGTGGESVFGKRFPDEINPTAEPYLTGYKRGVIAMANAGPNTNGSQFFIMQSDYPLPPNYTIFGKVIKGIEVVDAIAKVAKDGSDKPITPVKMRVRVKSH